MAQCSISVPLKYYRKPKGVYKLNIGLKWVKIFRKDKNSTRCSSFVTFYSLLVICYFLLVSRYLFFFFFRYSLFVTFYSLLVICYFLLVTRYLLFFTRYSFTRYTWKWLVVSLICGFFSYPWSWKIKLKKSASVWFEKINRKNLRKISATLKSCFHGWKHLLHFI